MGKIITNPEEKKTVTLNHFQNRMRKRKVVKEEEEAININEKIFEKRVVEAKRNKTPDFNMEKLENVLKGLKTGKSKDNDNYCYELFKDNVIGSDLKQSILQMMNKIKQKMRIPESLRRVSEKKYLGEIISKDGKNKQNIKDKTNKALGNKNKILSGLNERPYGKYTFQAEKLMRSGMLIGSLLNNSETWINILKVI